MTVQRDFIRQHVGAPAREVVALALAAKIPGVTNRLVHKVRWQDKDAARRKARNAAYDAVVVTRKVGAPALAPKKKRQRVDGPLGAVLRGATAMAKRQDKRAEPPVIKLVDSIYPAEREFLLLAYEIGHERSLRLLDMWRESVRRVVASI